MGEICFICTTTIVSLVDGWIWNLVSFDSRERENLKKWKNFYQSNSILFFLFSIMNKAEKKSDPSFIGEKENSALSFCFLFFQTGSFQCRWWWRRPRVNVIISVHFFSVYFAYFGSVHLSNSFRFNPEWVNERERKERIIINDFSMPKEKLFLPIDSLWC